MQQSESLLRVALYGRVSTEEQREGQTIQSQIAELERFAEQKGWQVSRIYKDDGWSGSLMARPALDELRDDASKGLFQAVLINDVDRLARDVTHLGVIKRDLERNGAQVIFRKLPGEQSPTHNLLVNILGSFAEFERELIADRTRRGRRHKVEIRKEFLGARAPYGFRYTPKGGSDAPNGKLEVLPEEAAVVKKMFSWVDGESLSARKVLSRLTQLGIPPRKRGKRWQKSSVLRILRSEVYVGVWYYNKHVSTEPRKPSSHRYRRLAKTSRILRPRSEWIPVLLPESLRILEHDLWARVQEKITRNIVFSPRNARHEYLLKGLVRCGACRHSYVGEPSKGKFSYRCGNRCKGYGSIREEYLNNSVWGALEAALQNPETIVRGVQSWVENLNTRSAPTDTDATVQARAQIDAEESRILEAYRLEILSPEQLKRELDSLQQRRELVERVLDERATPEQKREIPRRSIEEYCQLAARKIATLDPPSRRLILRELIREVVFEGTTIRIRGVIPAGKQPAQPIPEQPSGNGPSDGGIATTMPSDCGRNPFLTLPTPSSRSSPEVVNFELSASIYRDRTAAIAASKANLLKAIAARWKDHKKRA